MELIGLKFAVNRPPGLEGFAHHTGVTGMWSVLTEGRDGGPTPEDPSRTVGLKVDFFSAAHPEYAPVLNYLEFDYLRLHFSDRSLTQLPPFSEEVLRSGVGRFYPVNPFRTITLGGRTWVFGVSNPAKEVQYFDLRDEHNEGKGFAFFSLDALELLIRHSDFLTLSGAYVGYGAVKDPAPRRAPQQPYEEKAYFTLKFAGDMVHHHRWGAILGATNAYALSDRFREPIRQRILEAPELQSTNIADEDLPYVLAGHPCPPFWDPGRSITDAIMLEAGRQGWTFYNGDVEKWYLKLPDPNAQSGFVLIPQDQYRELVRLALFEYCHVNNYA